MVVQRTVGWPTSSWSLCKPTYGGGRKKKVFGFLHLGDELFPIIFPDVSSLIQDNYIIIS